MWLFFWDITNKAMQSVKPTLNIETLNNLYSDYYVSNLTNQVDMTNLTNSSYYTVQSFVATQLISLSSRDSPSFFSYDPLQSIITFLGCLQLVEEERRHPRASLL